MHVRNNPQVEMQHFYVDAGGKWHESQGTLFRVPTDLAKRVRDAVLVGSDGAHPENSQWIGSHGRNLRGKCRASKFAQR